MNGVFLHFKEKFKKNLIVADLLRKGIAAFRVEKIKKKLKKFLKNPLTNEKYLL